MLLSKGQLKFKETGKIFNCHRSNPKKYEPLKIGDAIAQVSCLIKKSLGDREI